MAIRLLTNSVVAILVLLSPVGGVAEVGFPGRFIEAEEAKEIVNTWLNAEFIGGRHTDRLQMIEEIEKENMK